MYNMKLVDGMLLYHGSYTPVKNVDLAKCAAGKDFGRGFYVTADKVQARNFIKTSSLLKAKRFKQIPESQNFGYVTCYKYNASQENIPVFEFEEANQEWLWFVSLNRRDRLAKFLMPLLSQKILKGEIIIGKIANDTTNPVITAYLNELYGKITDEEAARMAISLLLPHRLKDQYCFLSQRAVSCLEVVEVTKYEY